MDKNFKSGFEKVALPSKEQQYRDAGQLAGFLTGLGEALRHKGILSKILMPVGGGVVGSHLGGAAYHIPRHAKELMNKLQKGEKVEKVAAPYTSATSSIMRSGAKSTAKGLSPHNLTKYKIRKPKSPNRLGGVHGPNAFK